MARRTPPTFHEIMVLIRDGNIALLCGLLRMHRQTRCRCQAHYETIDLMEAGVILLHERLEKRRHRRTA